MIVMPPGRMFSVKQNHGDKNVWLGLSIALGGITGAVLYDVLYSVLSSNLRVSAPEILDSYKSQMADVPVDKDFVKSISAAGEHVSWVLLPVAEYRKPVTMGKMRHMAQRSNYDVVAFVRPSVQFSPSLDRVALSVSIDVYATGPHGEAEFLSGGALHVSTDVADAGSPLKSVGVEGIAASDINDSAAMGARANLWFEHGGARFKRAISMDMKKFQVVLENYLNGRHVAKQT